MCTLSISRSRRKKAGRPFPSVSVSIVSCMYCGICSVLPWFSLSEARKRAMPQNIGRPLMQQSNVQGIRLVDCASKVPRLTIATVGWKRIAAVLGVAGLFFSVTANAISCLEYCESRSDAHSAPHHHSAAPTASAAYAHGHIHAEAPSPPCSQFSSIGSCCIERATVATLGVSPETKHGDRSPLALASVTRTFPVSFSAPEPREHPKPPPACPFDLAVVPLRI